MEVIKTSDSTIKITTTEAPTAPVSTDREYDFDQVTNDRAKLISDATIISVEANQKLDVIRDKVQDLDSILQQMADLGVGSRVMPSPIQPIGDVIK